MHVLKKKKKKRSFRVRPKSPHLHFMESFTHVQRAALKVAGVFGLFNSTGHMKITV